MTNFIEKAQKSRKAKNWTIYKKQRSKCNNLIKKTKASGHQNLIEEDATNPKKFWDCLKAVPSSKSCGIQSCSNINLNSTVKMFSDYFTGAVKKLKSLAYLREKFTWQFVKALPRHTNKHFTFDYISRVFILKELKALKRQKTTCIVELPPGLLKDCAGIIVGPLTYRINLSIKISAVPSVTKVAKISPVFRSGDSSTPENHRQISILPIAFQIVEKAVHHNLITFPTDCQYEFHR